MNTETLVIRAATMAVLTAAAIGGGSYYAWMVISDSMALNRYCQDGSFRRTAVEQRASIADRGDKPYAESGEGSDLREIAGAAGQRYRVFAGGDSDGGPRPAILLLHEAGRTAASMIDMWRETAQRNGLVLIAPEGSGRWSGNQAALALLKASLEDAGKTTQIDPERVFLFGHADGAEAAIVLANRFEGPWKAVSVHGGAPAPRQVRESAEHPPIRIYLGSEDTSNPADGVERTGEALRSVCHRVEMLEIMGHTNWFYDIGPTVAEDSWTWFQRTTRNEAG